MVNTRNANSFTGDQGYKSMENIAEAISNKLNEKQKEDEDHPQKIKTKNIIFGCTGTIGEKFPEEKIKNKISSLINNIKYTQNKYIWMKAALGIMTTDTQPKMAMEECTIGNTDVKIYGIAKGSGMIQPNMATTLGYIFTDANLSNEILKKLLKKNIENTFNAISCDGDTSTNDMVSIFSTGKASHRKINSVSDKKLKDIGDKGELYIMDYEKERLQKINKNELIDKIKHVSLSNDSAGYDILSYNEDGTERFIEVKTTKGPIGTDFFISPGEMKFSEQNKDKYFIYRVYNYDTKAKRGNFYIKKGSVAENFELSPTGFKVSILA